MHDWKAKILGFNARGDVVVKSGAVAMEMDFKHTCPNFSQSNQSMTQKRNNYYNLFKIRVVLFITWHHCAKNSAKYLKRQNWQFDL